MTDTGRPEINMTCAEFQERLPELFETHTDLSAEEHLKTCENCAALVRDLEYIAQQAKLLLPIHDPSPIVWDNIRTAIRSEPADKGAGQSPSPSAGR
jgi:predicted anti-sigma-YlaC factor YlaD